MKKLQGLILILAIILIPSKVMAFTGGMTISCTPNTVKPQDTVSCTISGTSDVVITKIIAYFNFSDGFSTVTYSKNSAWNTGSLERETGRLLTETNDGNGVSGTFEIGTLTQLSFYNNVSNGAQNIEIKDIQYFDASNNSYNVENVNALITISNDEKKGLKSLKIDNKEPGIFNSSIYSYSYIIDSDTFKIDAVANNDNDSVTIRDAETGVNLGNSIRFVPNGANSDTMSITIIVGAGGEGNEYSLLVSKNSNTNTEDNGELKSLTVGGKNIQLSKDVYDYKVTLDDVSSYSIRASLNDATNFMIDTDNGGEGNYSGESTIPIIIKPRNNNSGLQGKTYYITITGKSSGSSGNNTPPPSNPKTGSISIFVITLVLMGSLILSLILYRKNISYYS